MTDAAPIKRPLVIDRCACSGTLAPITRGKDGLLYCLECGADQNSLVAYNDGLGVLDQMPLHDLAAALARRTASSPDLGLSDQVCPRCSTASTEVFGIFPRVERLFRCESCGIVLHGLGYERALEAFQAAPWRAEQASVQAAALGATA